MNGDGKPYTTNLIVEPSEIIVHVADLASGATKTTVRYFRLSEDEARSVHAMRTAQVIIGGDEPVQYDVIGMAKEIKRLRDVLNSIATEPLESHEMALRAQQALPK